MDSSSNKYAFDLSIVIATKHRHELMLRTINSISVHIPQDIHNEIIVIEETDYPRPVEEKGVKYISIPEQNRGFGFVRNLGLQKARGRIIAFVDDDVIPHEDWLKNLLAPFKDEDVAAVGGAILPDLSQINAIGKCITFLGFPAGGLRRYIETNGLNHESKLISTGNCAFRADLAREVGGFDSLLRWGGEDQEFFARLGEGSKTIFAPEAIVFHKQRDSLKNVFFWFIRRGKADFFRTCKKTTPLSSLILPFRSNFWLKLMLFFASVFCLFLFSKIAAMAFVVFAVVCWNAFLWHRESRVFLEVEEGRLSDEIKESKKAILCNKVTRRLFAVKFAMDIGQEIGKLIGFFRYLKHRVFSKPLVLTFHHLGEADPQMQTLDSMHYCPLKNFEIIIRESVKDDRIVLSFSEIIRKLRESPRSLYFEKILGVTFDDGYLSVFEPLARLTENGHYPFTVFVPTAFEGKTNQWDQIKGLRQKKLMDWSQIEELVAKGVEIGSHTRHHVDLKKSDSSTRKLEITDSLADLKKHLSDIDSSPITFSYPYGSYDQDVIQSVKDAGYIGAAANFKGNIRPTTDPFQIPRFTVFADSDWRSISMQSRSMWKKELLKDVRDRLFRRKPL